MVTFNGHVVHGTAATLTIIFMIVFVFAYVLPALYNCWILFDKAKKPGWAVIIPIYGPIVASRIAKLPLWVGILFGLAFIQVSGPGNIINIFNVIQPIVILVLGVVILIALSKQYKINRNFWILSVLLPLAASSMVKSAQYKPTR